MRARVAVLRPVFRRLAFVAAFGVLAGSAGASPDAAADAPDVHPGAVAAPSSWLAIGPVDRRGRRPFNPDTVFARYLLDRAAPPPREGETVEGSSGLRESWHRVEVDDRGRVAAGRITWAYAPLALEAGPRVVLARLRGGAVLYVNGDAYAGDVYGSGTPGLPVLLRAGVNHLFVRGVRGAFRLTLDPVDPGLGIADADAVLPDLVVGRAYRGEGSAVVFNAGPEAIPGVLLRARGADAGRARAGWRGAPEGLAPFAVRRLAFGLAVDAPEAPGAVSIELAGLPRGARSLELAVREPGDPRRVTFRSAIDGSVQRYALREPGGDPTSAGVVLTLHGAGVDSWNQARAYSPKEGLWIVAPTNRRPFGFDWQDWGRRDAYEVLAHTLRTHGGDGTRVYLTGHSMGGHGTWHLAANDPDRWSAIAPSAGWATFETYVGRPGSALGELWRGADLASDTLALVPNLVPVPAFVLHGAADDNVPPREALLMQALLVAAGGSPRVHFEPGAGHWWDGERADGADCVDWPDLFRHFAQHRADDAARRTDSFEWIGVDPAVDAHHRFLTFLQPRTYGEPARFRVRRDGGTLHIETTNVRRFLARPLAPPLTVVVDGDALDPRRHGGYLRTDGRWTVAAPDPSEKGPERSGPFKRVFDRRFILVVGAGDGEAAARARYDAQAWWYRGNGDAPIVTDRVFLDSPEMFAGRNVVLYGNAESNAAWDRVFGKDAPLRVTADAVRLGERRWTGRALGAVFVLPRADDPVALAGAFASTGTEGARLGYALLPFVSGVGYPDYAVFDRRIVTAGDEGVLAAGWFGPRWSVEDRP